MTGLGKLLVLLNLFLSVVFMGAAASIYSTSQDLRGSLKKQTDAVAAKQGEIGGLQQQLADLNNKLATADTNLRTALTTHQTQISNKDNQITTLQKQLDDSQKSLNDTEMVNRNITDNRTERTSEIDKFKQRVDELLKKNADLNNEKTDLLDNLSRLTNELEIVNKRNQDVAERTKQLEDFIVAKLGELPGATELGMAEGIVPPNVEGVVRRVDNTGKFVQISLGKDDGIRIGQTLEVWRTRPNPQYLGQLKIFSAENTSAVAQPVANTGLIREGDHVGPKVMLND